MSEAGITWCRTFPDWGTFEPTKGQWNLDAAQKMLDSAAKNNIHISGLFLFSPAWAFPPGAKGVPLPMTHLDDWSEYIGKVVGRYKNQVHYWEVWNEPNLAFKGHYSDGRWDTTADYATLVMKTYAAAKKSDPKAQLGLSVASFDAPYIDQVILNEAKRDKPENFDYLCIHPYEIVGGLAEADGEIPYLWMTHLLRDMLKTDAPGKANAQIWVTEVGRPIKTRKEDTDPSLVSELVAAQTLVKVYIMGIAQGIRHICWFEAEDPPVEAPGYGLLRIDGSKRLLWTAMKSMTGYLGELPKYQGWLALGAEGRGYGFVFQGTSSPVLIAWMPLDKTDKTICFTGDVQIVNPLTNTLQRTLKKGQPLTLTDSPVIIVGLPANLLTQAQGNAIKNFPWGGDFSKATAVSIELGAPNINKGIIQVARTWTKPHKFADSSSGAIVSRPGKQDSQNIKFMVHPSFANLETHDYYVRVTARRLTPAKLPKSYCGMNLVYEIADSKAGSPYNTAQWFGLSDDAKWQSYTWHVTDACFSKMWGYDIAFSIGHSDPFVIGKVEINTQPFAN